MSLSECTKCGGRIPLGPDASNVCEQCGAGVFLLWHNTKCRHCGEVISGAYADACPPGSPCSEARWTAIVQEKQAEIERLRKENERLRSGISEAP